MMLGDFLRRHLLKERNKKRLSGELYREEHMFGIGIPELVIVLVIVLIVFGAGRLPEIGAGIGNAIKNFKKATIEKDEEEPKEIEDKTDHPKG
jgi:sec-independent protein translocase protein TatA